MIGVSEYKSEAMRLSYPAKDATDLSDALSSSAKKLLNTDNSNHVFMYDLTTNKEHYRYPDKKAIKNLFDSIALKATAKDILLVFFAGHGVVTGEGDKKLFYLLTADASSFGYDNMKDAGISTLELTDWIKPSKIKAQKRILIFDACQSGQLINESSFNARGGIDQRDQEIKSLDKLNEKSGLFILCATSSNQSAYEMQSYSHGLLTYCLLKTIKQNPDILRANQYLDLTRWFTITIELVEDLVKKGGVNQEPQIFTNNDFNIGKVDKDVKAKITLKQEDLPYFKQSNFHITDEDADDLDLTKLIDAQLNKDGSESKIVYTTDAADSNAYSLSGHYEVTGDSVNVTINVRQNKKNVQPKFNLSGTKDKLNDLAKAIVEYTYKILAKKSP